MRHNPIPRPSAVLGGVRFADDVGSIDSVLEGPGTDFESGRVLVAPEIRGEAVDVIELFVKEVPMPLVVELSGAFEALDRVSVTEGA